MEATVFRKICYSIIGVYIFNLIKNLSTDNLVSNIVVNGIKLFNHLNSKYFRRNVLIINIKRCKTK